MPNFLINTCINALKCLLAFERQYMKGKVFIEDEKWILDQCVDLLVRIRDRSVGPFHEEI